MKVIDLFSGAGGLSEGFRRNSFEIIAHVEIDNSACETLRVRESYYYLKATDNLDIYYKYLKGKITKNELFSIIPKNILDKVIEKEISKENFEYITTKINQKFIGNIDGIIGGPPCQAYSIAGRSRDKNSMKNDPRNYLYKEYIEYIKYYKPKFFLFENVPGIYTAGKGMILKDIKKRMREVGYTIELRELNARDFGVSENRRRVIILGWKKEIDISYPVFEKEEPLIISELFRDLPKISAGERVEYKRLNKKSNYEALKEKKIIQDNNYIITQHISRPNNDRDLEIYKIIASEYKNNNRKMKYDELPKKLLTHRNQKSFLDRYKVIPYNDISHTIVAHISKDGHHFIHPDIEQNRSITIREAARIQSFPDNYYFETSRTSAFKQIGNAVPPLMAEKIANKIKEELEK